MSPGKCLRKPAALMEETEGIIETLRNISGVEISAFLKESRPGEIKVGCGRRLTATFPRSPSPLAEAAILKLQAAL